jgi:hypothetical protein
MAKGSGGSFKAPSGGKSASGGPKQPPTSKGYLQKPRNYVHTVLPVRPEPSMKIAPTPKGPKPPRLVK